MAVARSLEVLLHNVRSVYNVGSMFRTADGAGVKHIYITGFSPTPEHPKMHKTSLGSEDVIPWSQQRDPLPVVAELRRTGRALWAVETTSTAVSLFDSNLVWPDRPVVLLFGNEITGLSDEVVATCDRTVAIPMGGIKESLNVSVAFGIAVYTVLNLPPGER